MDARLGMRAYVEAYGCTLNYGESREIEDLLAGRGWMLSSTPEGCDLIVIATCVVIETTERAMLKRLEELKDSPRLIVTGCMATACRDKAEAVVPRASFIAPGDIEAVSAIIEDVRLGQTIRRPPRRESYGIVPIATGCLGNCAYCITKVARGELSSRSPSGIVESVRSMVSAGPIEVQLTSQDTAAYGLDIGTDLFSLVKSICAIKGDFRLRVGMMNPKTALPVTRQLAEMYREPKVFKFLHLPVQSASDEVLRHMGRNYEVADFRRIVESVRMVVPDLTLSTDIIVGYPGERDDDHRANLELIREFAPDIVNVTRFSVRPGTRAADEPGQIVGWKAKQRSREMTALRFRVALDKNRRWIGREVTALATEHGKQGTTILRTDEYKQIVVPEELQLRDFYRVEVVGATPTYLRGQRTGRG